jgi:hypothetical protein
MGLSHRWGRAVRRRRTGEHDHAASVPGGIEVSVTPTRSAPSDGAAPDARRAPSTSAEDRIDRLTSLLDQYGVDRGDGPLRLVPMPDPEADPSEQSGAVVPARDLTVPPLAPSARTGDRRRHLAPAAILTLGPARLSRLTCMSCGTPANIDIVDRLNGRVHLSCPSCFRMWQDRVRAERTADPTAAMRD